MKFSNNDFSFFRRKKKKKAIPSLDTLKLISFITGTALTVNKALKEKIRQQHVTLQSKKQAESEETALIIAGFVGGILAGALTALLLAPESGQDMRNRISGYFDNGHEEDLQKATQQAKKKAKKVENKVNGSNSH